MRNMSVTSLLLTFLFLVSIAACTPTAAQTKSTSGGSPQNDEPGVTPKSSAQPTPTNQMSEETDDQQQEMSSATAVTSSTATPPHSTATATEENPSPPTPEQKITPPNGWQTWESKQFQIALDYPGDWSVDESDNQLIVFSSPQGATINLTLAAKGENAGSEIAPVTRMPNMLCTSKVNPYGIEIQLCTQTASFEQTAVSNIDVAGETISLVMTTRMRSPETLMSMMETVRPLSP